MVNLGSSLEQTMMGQGPNATYQATRSLALWFWRRKFFEGFLPYMDVATILVMWPRPREQTFVPPSHWGSIWNLALIGPAVLEKTFENGGLRTTMHGPWLYYKLTNEPKGSGELKMNLLNKKKKKPCETDVEKNSKLEVLFTPFKVISLVKHPN